MNPANADAARHIAQIADRAGRSRCGGLRWRKVVDLRPNNTEDALGLVRSALRVNDLATAENTLGSFDDDAKRDRRISRCGRPAGRDEEKNPVAAEGHWARSQ